LGALHLLENVAVKPSDAPIMASAAASDSTTPLAQPQSPPAEVMRSAAGQTKPRSNPKASPPPDPANLDDLAAHPVKVVHCEQLADSFATKLASVPSGSKEVQASEDDSPPSPARHSIDFRSVHWYGDNYDFTEAQAAVVAVLWKDWKTG